MDFSTDSCNVNESSQNADEHPSMENIREAIQMYQLQTPAHYELEIGVSLLTNVWDNQLDASVTKANILFQGYNAEGPIGIPGECRIVLNRYHSQPTNWTCTVVSRDRSVKTLEDFLSSTFPIIDGPLRPCTLWRWWQNNGKKFDWLDLPTELKELILEFCVHQPRTCGVYSEKLASFHIRYKPNRKIRKIGPLEIVDQLGDWYQLLYVSHQVRALTLRLCINGGSSLVRSKGLCITSSSYHTFVDRINRLGDYYQMIAHDSIPTNANEEALSKCYRRYPRIYPHLNQYATFRHGIRKISLGMDFLSSMHFFKVEAGGFKLYQKPRGLTYHIFERLPHLNEIVIRLPLRPRGGWKDNPCARGPWLFHHQSPCPRSLHRIIYERVAEVLAPYNVTVRNFVDAHEKERFLAARIAAMDALKFTAAELQELYADDGGGVEVPRDMEQESEVFMTKVLDQDLDVEYTMDLQDDFFPPLCQCGEPCASSLVLGASEHH